MIKINFSYAISLYLCISIIVVFIVWIFYNYRRDGILNETKYLQQCPYCTYIFFSNASRITKEKRFNTGQLSESANGQEEKNRVLACPRCHSYINPVNQSEKEDK